MSLWAKIIGAGIALVVVVGIVAYGMNAMNQRSLERARAALRTAQERVDMLNGEVTSLNHHWATQEEKYQDQIALLNGKINARQREINGLKRKIADLEKQRAEIVIPHSPDLICPEFHRMGFKSCTRAVPNR